MNVGDEISNLSELSVYLGFAPQHIYKLVYSNDNFYTNILIPKKTEGEFRELSIPSSELKGVQRSILKQILEMYPVDEHAYAYVKGRGLIPAAKKLCGRNALLKMDLSDFFPSIISKRVFGLMKSLGFNNKVSYILTKLTTHNGSLSQGSPTSPYISNLICNNLDKQFTKFTSSWGMNYIRYCDDLFFYGHSNFDWMKFSQKAIVICEENGFLVNGAKTKYSAKGKHRYTLGLQTSGRFPAIPKKTRRLYRAQFHKASHNIVWATQNLDRLNGILQWYKVVHGQDDQYFDYRNIIRNAKKLAFHEPYLSS